MNNRIMFYMGSLYKGGAERVASNLVKYFHEKGYHVTMVTKLKEPVEYELPAGVERILADITKDEERGRVQNLFLRIKKLRRIIKEVNPNIVVSFIGKNNLMSVAATRGLGIPVVVSVRSNPAREIGSGLKRMLTFAAFGMAKGVVLQTQEAKEFFPKFIQKKAIVLQNSLDPKFIREPYKGERRKEIVTVGRIDLNKNQRMLVEAFANIAEKYPDWNVSIYGEGPDFEYLKKRVKELQMEERILFMGVREDIPDRIEGSSIFVLPSKQEGMPNALIEAMVLGLAVISTDCPSGGPRDLIEQGENGILIPVDDMDAMANSLERLIQDDKMRKKLGENAMGIKKRVLPEKVNSQWEEYLNRIGKLNNS